MRHASVGVSCIGMPGFFQETAEKGCACSPVEAMVVVQNSYFHLHNPDMSGKTSKYVTSGLQKSTPVELNLFR